MQARCSINVHLVNEGQLQMAAEDDCGDFLPWHWGRVYLDSEEKRKPPFVVIFCLCLIRLVGDQRSSAASH